MSQYNYWEDLAADKKAPATGDTLWTCNCQGLITSKSYGNNNVLFLPTVIDKDEVCVSCGYYAVKMLKSEMESNIRISTSLGKNKTK